MRTFVSVFCLALAIACAYQLAQTPAWAQDNKKVDSKKLEELGKKLEEFSLEDLMNVEIVSASNKAEKLSDAPATVIVISRADIVKRGYLEMSEIFDDLPGMDIARSYGDTYSKNYWRGYRNSIGSPYLLMVDNIILNNLYFNEAEGISALPLSNVERIEIVYGPASSVYGPNAFMGVINVITRKNADTNGVSVRGKLSVGSLDQRIGDVNIFYKKDDMRISVTGRFDNGTTDGAVGANYEYTKPGYLQNRRLWGTLLDNPNLAGNPLSPHQNNGIDARIFLGNTEVGFLMNSMRTGYGYEYPTDKVQPNAVWSRPQYSVHLRHVQEFSSNFSSTTLMRYRQSDISNDSYFVEGYAGNSRGDRVVDVSFWQALCNSMSLYQDFNYSVTKELSFNAGVKYERKDLSKAYDVVYGSSVSPDSIANKLYPFPVPPSAIQQYQNRILVFDEGVYLQGKYRFQKLFGAEDEHNFTLGIRLDNNSVYGQARTLRVGYVGNFGSFGVKALYGEAFQEPTPRQLFGGWRGAGSDPALKPELSNTLEGSVSYTLQNFSALLSVYSVNNQNTIVNVSSGAQNLGSRNVLGADVHLQALVPISGIKQLSLWAYYSFIASSERQIVNGQITDTRVRIGDLADHKIYIGANCDITQDLNVTLRGRYIGQRITIAANPVGAVDPYFTLDANLTYSNLFFKGLGVALRVANLFNAQYFHPGVRDAGAGSVPGAFDSRGVWQGSSSFYSSLLPQFGRTIQFSFIVDL
jgi:outer membrane cobalamin receptor